MGIQERLFDDRADVCAEEPVRPHLSRDLSKCLGQLLRDVVVFHSQSDAVI